MEQTALWKWQELRAAASPLECSASPSLALPSQEDKARTVVPLQLEHTNPQTSYLPGRWGALLGGPHHCTAVLSCVSAVSAGCPTGEQGSSRDTGGAGRSHRAGVKGGGLRATQQRPPQLPSALRTQGLGHTLQALGAGGGLLC